MSARYPLKTSTLANRKPSSFKKDRFDKSQIKTPEEAAAQSTWTRPTDWLPQPTILPTEQKIALLIPVYNFDSNWVAFTISGAYTVDWGDGTVQNFAAGARAQRNYNYNNPSITSPVRSDGSKLVYAIITPQAGQNFTSVNFNVLPVDANQGTFPNSSPIIEILYSAPNSTSPPTIGNFNSVNIFLVNLISFVGIHMGTGTQNGGDLFRNCTMLINVDLQNVPDYQNISGMFCDCWSLTNISLFNTATVTGMNNMFGGCRSLTSVPFFNTASVVTMSGMFYSNISFEGCRSLKSVPLFNTSAVADMSNMFNGALSLTNIPLFNTASVTDMNNMFNGCSALTTVPLFNTAAVTNMTSMFGACRSLTTVPLLNTAAVTNMTSMFSGCSALTTVPLFNTAAVTNMTTMFSNCFSLKSVPLFNTAAVTSMTSMFSACLALATVPLFNTSAVTSMNSMFSSTSLRSVPLFNTAAVTSMNNMFSSCNALTSAPLFNTSAATNMSNMFSGCTALISVNFSNVSAGTITSKFNAIFTGCRSLSRVVLGLAEYSLSVASANLSQSALTETMNGLDNVAAASQTLTISNNPGAPTPITVSGGTTAGLNTVNITNTTGIVVGMQATGTGTGLTTGRAVTFTDADDLVALNGHGLQNGDVVMFSAITTTTGIVINRQYFVVNATADTFQVALTSGGAAINLVSNGSGTVRYANIVTAINPNVSVTFDRPLAGTGTNTLAFRTLPTRIALLKGWAVTG